MTKNEFQIYLDNAIRYWRRRRQENDPIAIYYVDALQAVRDAYFGELLPPDNEGT